MSEISSKCAKDDEDGLNRRRCPLCRYDCRDVQIDKNSAKEHYLSEKHQNSILKSIPQTVESTSNDSIEADVDTEESDTTSKDYEKLSRMIESIDQNHNEIEQIEDGTLQCRKTLSNLSEQLNDTESDISLQKSQIEAITLNQNVLKYGANTLKQRIEDKDELIKQEPDGTMVWKITNVREKIYDAQSERQTSIYSPPFYTAVAGYKVCVRLYLNGDGTSRASFISIFLVILRGPYDGTLTWPFSARVSFCLCDQRTMIESNGTVQPQHIIESFRPDTNSVSFQRPITNMNIASGIPRFYSLNDFNQPTNENLYVVNDTMYIKTFIDFIGLPRAMVPFVFNINIGLPPHTQHKLIYDEFKKREQENVTN